MIPDRTFDNYECHAHQYVFENSEKRSTAQLFKHWYSFRQSLKQDQFHKSTFTGLVDTIQHFILVILVLYLHGFVFTKQEWRFRTSLISLMNMQFPNLKKYQQIWALLNIEPRLIVNYHNATQNRECVNVSLSKLSTVFDWRQSKWEWPTTQIR